MSPAQIQYIIDTILGVIIAGAIAAGEQWTATGTVDTRVLGVAFVGGAIAFGRKWLSVQLGADSVALPIKPANAQPPVETAPPPLVDGHALPPHG